MFGGDEQGTYLDIGRMRQNIFLLELSKVKIRTFGNAT